MSSQHHILHFEPAVLSFRDVKLNQAYNASLCISNPMTAGVDFTLRASSARYTVVPNRVFLNAGQSIYVSVKLLLNHYPNISRGKAGIEDYIHVKSTYFDQRIPLEFSLVTSMSERRSRSASPSRAGSSSFPTSTVNNHTPDQGHDMLLDLKAQVTAKDRRIEELELLVGKLETKHPNLQEIIHSRLEMERIVFEEKSEKVR